MPDATPQTDAHANREEPATPRQLAEQQVRHFRAVGRPDMADKWLEYLTNHLADGTADDPRPQL